MEQGSVAKRDSTVTFTITDLSGRTLSGQTPTAFWHSVRHAKPFTIGLIQMRMSKQARENLDKACAMLEQAAAKGVQ